MIKHIGYVDRVWGDSPAKKVWGDMGWWFEDAPETRTEDVEALVGLSLDYVLGPEPEMNCETFDEDEGRFAIYIVKEADLEVDEDEDLYRGRIIFETITTREVHVCATREQAGWIEDNNEFKGHKIIYK